MLSPNTCFVLDDGNGRAVGYIIGTPSTTELVKKWEDVLIPVVDPKLVPRPVPGQEDPNEPEIVRGMKKAIYEAECSMLQSKPHLLERYPAHLHIDILPEYQRKGWGSQLMKVFLAEVKNFGASGVHLGMVRTNDGAKRFYEKQGFQLCGEVLDEGKSGEVGREGNAVCMIRSL
jgi:ribosomal protein S18 acetylase RimI-like enzyme